MGCRGWVLTRGCVPQIGCTKLHDAARKGHPKVVKQLLQEELDIAAYKYAVSERKVGCGGLWIRTSRDFGES